MVEKRSFVSAAVILQLRTETPGKAEGTEQEPVRQNQSIPLPLRWSILSLSLHWEEGKSLES